MTPLRRLAPLAVLLAIATPALTACGSTTVIDNDVLETEITSLYEGEVDGSTVEDVDCPEDVEVVAGETFTCAFTTDTGAEGEVTVTMSNDEGDVNIDVSRFPDDISSAVIENDIATDFSSQNISDPAVEVSCPETLDLEAGSDCVIETESGEQYIATVTQSDGQLAWEYFETE